MSRLFHNFSVDKSEFNTRPALYFYAADRGCLPKLNELAGHAGCVQKKLTLEAFYVVSDQNCHTFVSRLPATGRFKPECIQAALKCLSEMPLLQLNLKGAHLHLGVDKLSKGNTNFI